MRRCRRRNATAVAVASALATSVQGDLDTLGLVVAGLGVDVVLALVSSAGVEGRVTIMLELAAAADGEARVGGCALVALELGRRRGQDTATAVAIGDGVAVEAVLACWVAAADAVLAVAELTDLAGLLARSTEREAALVLTREDCCCGAGCEADGCNESLHVDESGITKDKKRVTKEEVGRGKKKEEGSEKREGILYHRGVQRCDITALSGPQADCS